MSGFAYSSDEEFIDNFEKHSWSVYCASELFLSCLGVDSLNCANAIKVSNSGCISEKLLNAVSGEIDDDAESLSVIKSESQLYSVCLTDKFMEALSISDAKLDGCMHHLQPIFEAQKESIKRKHEQIQKKIDEQQ
ncbi:MAG: hypothetical protein AB2746_12945 [Candidatus Thiodiazotropha taylori]